MQTLGNILWLIFVGIWLAIGFVVAGIIMFVLIITIPFGIQAFKLAGFALWPFGRHVEYTDRVHCLIGGVILCITIIGIPFGIQAFKLIPIALMPFGAEVVSDRRMAAA